MKTCGKCKVDKSLDEFYPRSDANGVRSDCKACMNLRRKLRYFVSGAEELRKNREWELANGERVRFLARQWTKNNPLKAKEKNRRRYLKDSEKEIARTREWQRNNRYKVVANAAKHRAGEAVPAWANEEKIALFYEEATFATEFFGIPFHVDHIVPLSGVRRNKKIVCGLHWEGNLQVITDAQNYRKNNCYWPDMP